MWIKIKNIKKGDVFYERYSGMSLRMAARFNAKRVREPLRNGYEVKVLLDDRRTITIFEAINAGAYGLNLYSGDYE